VESAGAVFLDYSIRKLEQYLSRIVTCCDQLSDEQIWTRSGDHENAVGNLLLHLAGNVRQRIIGAVGGAPDTRERDQEFAARGDVAKAELIERLRATVTEAVAVLRALDPDRLTEICLMAKQPVPILEAIYHVVEHFSMHTGQILFATKLLTGQDLGFYKHLNPPASPQRTS
jgi:uncharacterized damage-inducible protein DinB